LPRRILVIFNPAAGRSRGRSARLRRVVALLEERGCTVAVRATAGPGDALRLARDADPAFDMIVAAGGDGTVNEVANGVFAGSRPFAIVPLGTGNVLANEIGLPRRLRDLARLIAEGLPQPLWPGRAGDRLFLAMTGIGFDAAVLGALDQHLKRRLGKLAFAWPILTCVYHYRRREFVFAIDGAAHRAASAIIVKGRLYAGRFVVVPGARVVDPLLHVVLFRRAGRGAVLRYLAAMLLGILHRLPDVAILAARRISIAAGTPEVSGYPVLETDGEIGGSLPLVIEIAERPLLLVQPAGCTADEFRNRLATPLV
jgi:diacylglycerol kinase (ATP)